MCAGAAALLAAAASAGGGGACAPSSWMNSTGSSGDKITTSPAGSPADCCAQCEQLANCTFWTLNPKKCILKSGTPKFQDEDGYVSGRSSRAPSPAPPPATPAPHPQPPAPAGLPNVVLLLTDDQDILLGSMDEHEGAAALPTVAARLRAGGATMSQYAAHTPVCCPSRSELLSGRYFHNIRTETPDSAANECMHVNASLGDFEPHTVASYLWKGGYTTGMFGKYLNNGGMQGLCPSKGESDGAVPFGWDRFFAMCPDTCYNDCVFSDQGTWVKRDDPKDPNGANYATSVMANESLAWLEQIHADTPARPFLLYLAPHAPHGPATPAPWYEGKVWGDKTVSPRTASYNYTEEDRNWMVRTQPIVTAKQAADWDDFYRDRLRSLLSVDDAFAGVTALLDKQGRGGETYYFFTSDHGLHIGQFRMGPCKRTLYETDLRVPFFVAGPGVAPGRVLPALVGHADLAPTILALAGVAAPARMDGRSFAHLFTTQAEPPAGYTPRDAYLIEYYATKMSGTSVGKGHVKDAPNNTFIALRMNSSDPAFAEVGGGELVYAEYTDVHDWAFELNTGATYYELYDLRGDPDQLHNIYATASTTLRGALHTRLRAEWACRGTEGAGACR